MENKVLILDFGSQFTQLIARRVRELNVYCEIHPYNSEKYSFEDYQAIILSGSPHSVRSEQAPQVDLSEVKGKKPLLGVCYGAQYLAQSFGGEVGSSNTREYGRAHLHGIDANSPLFSGIQDNSQVWMSHSDTILKLPDNCTQIASTEDVANAAFSFDQELTFGIQFHPEVYHSVDGRQLLKNFLVDIAGLDQSWTPNSFIEETVQAIKEKVGDERVVLGLSEGDSSVAAVLLDKATGVI